MCIFSCFFVGVFLPPLPKGRGTAALAVVEGYYVCISQSFAASFFKSLTATPLSGFLVSKIQISGIYLIQHVRNILVIAVGDDNVTLRFKRLDVVNHTGIAEGFF